MAMANRRDGGVVIIGVDEAASEDDDPLVVSGLSPEQTASWNHDDVGDSLIRYTDPPIDFNCEIVVLDGKRLAVIEVESFRQIPILCKKDYPGILRDGACYVRSLRKPESVEVPTHHEMRSLIEMAAEKELRRFLQRAEGAGIEIRTEPEPSESERYEAELSEDLRWTS